MSEDSQNKQNDSELKNSDALLVDFFSAVSFLRTEKEANLFLSDLLSDREIRQLAKRLRIAIFLVSGYSYRKIRRKLGVGINTIVKVSTWLERQGDGYKIVISRLAEMGSVFKEQDETDYEAQITKRASKHRKYPDIFWPAEIISAIGGEIQRASSKNRKNSKKEPLQRSRAL